MSWLNRNWQDSLTVLGAIAFGSLLLAVAAFGRPISRTAPDDIPYTQTGEFGYSAPIAGATGVYDGSTGARTGDPVFLRLSDSLSATFTYRVAAGEGVALVAGGTSRLTAELTSANGWKRTIILADETPFRGTPVTVTGAIDLNWVRAQVESLERQTGLQNQSYSLAVVPQIHTEGTLRGEPFAADFSPRLPLKLDQFDLHLPTRDAADADPLSPVVQTALKQGRSEANMLPLLFIELPVAAARWLAVVLGMVCSIAAAGAIVAMQGGRWLPQARPPSEIEARYGDRVVTVRGLARSRGRIIDVASEDDLIHVAESEGCPILRETGPDELAYFVQAGETTYRFQAETKPASAVRTRAA
jgi:hypothetical protein